MKESGAVEHGELNNVDHHAPLDADSIAKALVCRRAHGFR